MCPEALAQTNIQRSLLIADFVQVCLPLQLTPANILHSHTDYTQSSWCVQLNKGSLEHLDNPAPSRERLWLMADLWIAGWMERYALLPPRTVLWPKGCWDAKLQSFNMLGLMAPFRPKHRKMKRNKKIPQTKEAYLQH